jgi:putative FmdB family regulatory protein
MPLYEYRCNTCGETFEVMQKFSDAPVEQCRCEKASKVERLISSPALQFKGSGWYVTDYARSGGKSESKISESKSSETKSAESKASETKSESKPAPKAD